MAAFAARRFRRLEITTLPEFFERHYGVTARILGVVGQLVIQIVVTSLQYVAGGVILSALLPEIFDIRTGMAVTAAVFVGITLIGGFWAAGLTNVINVFVIYVGIGLAAYLTVGKIGGLSALADRLPPTHPGFDLWAMGPGLIAAWFLVMITMSHSTQSVIQIGFAARDHRAATRAYFLGGVLIAPVGFIGALIGLAAAALHPGILPTEALPRVVLDLSPLAAGIILAGLWAADVSTASALLMGSATLVVNDIIKRFFAPDLTPRREEAVCRWIVLGLSGITFSLALAVKGILQALLVGLTISTAYTLIVLMTLLWPRMCRRSSAAWTLGLTMVALGLWLVFPADWRFVPHPIYWTWGVSLLVFFGVSCLDGRGIGGPVVGNKQDA
jgi:SSS family solute:Na+ symporter